jgi:hypothetical protein
MMASAFGMVIVLLSFAAIGMSLTIPLVGAQTIPIPEFQPKTPRVQDDGSVQTEPETEPEPPRPTDFAMKFNLNHSTVSLR